MKQDTHKFKIVLHKDIDASPSELYVSVLHRESGTCCDFYESGKELDWQGSYGLLRNCDEETVAAAREAARYFFNCQRSDG